ncbi:MAG: alpha/beta hydrolase [Bacteroidota bacterium]
MPQPTIACIPGLGFTSAIYRKLDWGDYIPQMLEWLQPVAHDETIQAYAQRMLDQIEGEATELILIGHSFGGVMAQEMARLRPIKQLILISSIRSPKEIPWRYKILAPLKLDFLFRRGPAIITLPIWGPPFGYKTSEEQALFREMVSQQTHASLQWSLRQFSGWQELPSSETPVHSIHGTNDKTLPFAMLQKVDDVVKEGSHIMLFNRAPEVQDLIIKVLEQNNHK